MWEWLGSAASSIIGGGVTGLAGAAITAWIEHKKQAAQFEHEYKMETVRQDGMRLESELNLKKIITEADAQKEVADSNAFMHSYSTDKASYYTGGSKWGSAAMAFVDLFRGITRPGITWYMAIVATWLTYETYSHIEGIEYISKDQLLALLHSIVSSMLYITTTCMLWWFGTRVKVTKTL